MRILIVEDELHLAVGLKYNFEQEGYEVVVTSNGPDALAEFMKTPAAFDLVILDLMLPGMSGYEICRALRADDPYVPILVLTARTLSEDKAHAFDSGTDQYLTKPFELRELLSRVRNLLRRRSLVLRERANQPQPLEVYAFDNVHVDFRKFEVRVDSQTHPLTTLEMQLLRLFIQNEGTVLSRKEILDKVWGIDSDVTTRTVDNFVMRLRKLIEQDPANPKHLVSVRGTGYRFDAK